MGAPKTREEMSRELRRQMVELQRERRALRQAVYQFEAALQEESQTAKIPFPLSLVNDLIGATLDVLERIVRRLVRAIVR